jgi:hypothetical protein
MFLDPGSSNNSGRLRAVDEWDMALGDITNRRYLTVLLPF